MNASLSRATWQKYSSGIKAFACFEAAQRTSYNWPISVETFRHFALWCYTERGLKHTSIKTFLAAVRFGHTLRGLSHDHLAHDSILATIMKGLKHESLAYSPSPTRRVVTFKLLLTIGHKISGSSWDPLTKQVIWAACTVAFFGSVRLGEILASEENAFSPFSDLTWKDVLLTKSGSFLIRIKQPKSGEPEGEYVDLFPFRGYKCCPVKALKKLAELQKVAGVFDPDQPVFRIKSGAYLTMQKFNRILTGLLSDVCKPGVDSITCHSFRAGIPSLLSTFPELATSDMIKGWGRWHSECYSRYTRLQLPQREKIFSSIASALMTVVPLPTLTH
jgi:hypothetical protein